MKKTTKTIIVLSTAFIAFAVIGFLSPEAHSNSTGAPQAKTGSPGDGSSCASGVGCHGGNNNPTAGSNMIFVNTPAAGYTPGATYTVIVTATGMVPITPGKYGFEVSPQNTAGALKGTLVVTNSTETQLIAAGKYITHKSAGTSVPIAGQKSWTFDWIAPAAGNGAVTFYGAIVYANGTGSSSGDYVITTSTTIQENTVGIKENSYVNENNWTIYPNPSTDRVIVKSLLNTNENIKYEIIDVCGRTVKEITDLNLLNNSSIDISDLNNGIYSLSIHTNEGVINKKFIKNK